MKPHLQSAENGKLLTKKKPFNESEERDKITRRLSAIDAEMRSIRAMLFSLAEEQKRNTQSPEDLAFRTADDYIRQHD